MSICDLMKKRLNVHIQKDLGVLEEIDIDRGRTSHEFVNGMHMQWRKKWEKIGIRQKDPILILDVNPESSYTGQGSF